MGLTLPSFKEISLSTAQIKKAVLPNEVTIDLNQHQGIPAISIVSAGDQVLTGSKIAYSSGELSCNYHSSISGKVKKVTSKSITIESDHKDEWDPKISEQKSWKFFSSSEIQNALIEAGVLDSLKPHLPIQLFFGKPNTNETLVIDACESESFLTADYILMLCHAGEIAQGVELLLKATGVKRAVIVTEDDKREPAEVLLSKIRGLHLEFIEVKILKRQYPQKFKTSSPKLGLSTAHAAYEAVRFKKPQIEQVVTVSGHCVVEPKNIWCRIGTSVEEVFDLCKGLLREPDRVVVGGPMTGTSIAKLDFSIQKGTKALLALAPEYLNEAREESCIRCGFCADVCPEQLLPESLMRFVRKKQKKHLVQYRLDQCTECGNCTYVCPSKIRLSGILREGKEMLVKS